MQKESKKTSEADLVRVTETDEYVLSEGMVDDLLEGIDSLGSELDEKGKHTYCCTMGWTDGSPREKQQFRSYSWQAPLFCMRMAKKKGWTTGSVSRGECEPIDEEAHE